MVTQSSKDMFGGHPSQHRRDDETRLCEIRRVMVANRAIYGTGAKSSDLGGASISVFPAYACRPFLERLGVFNDRASRRYPRAEFSI